MRQECGASGSAKSSYEIQPEGERCRLTFGDAPGLAAMFDAWDDAEAVGKRIAAMVAARLLLAQLEAARDLAPLLAEEERRARERKER